MNNIKNVVLDLGGVILNLNVANTINEFKRLGIRNLIGNTGHDYTHSVFYNFEIGKISEIDFINELKSMSNINPSAEDITRAWNSMILDIPKTNIDLLLNLKNTHRIFLLSNTNSIHYKKFIPMADRKCSVPFNELFDEVYYSHEIGLRKPDKEIFNFLLQENGLNPKETLFIDDSIDNIKMAKEVGLKVSHFSKGSLEKNISKNENII